MEPLLSIKNLCVRYETGRAVAYALNGVNLSIQRGEALGLVGESGAGKTTTALATLNLIPQPAGRITDGEIYFEGKSVLSMKKKELMAMRGNKISMIFQNPLTSLNPVFTVGEQIGMVLRKHKNLSAQEANREAGKLLEVVGIPGHRVNEFPHQFSGGMRQRVGIAAALACNPALLIADEPTTALDVTIQAQILELIKELLTKYSSSLLMITHNLGIIAEICENVAVMYAGRIVEYGSVEEVFQFPAHCYTKGLFNSIPKLEGPRERLASIPGTVANPERLPSGCPFHERCGQCMEKCKTELPQMIKINDRHLVACHLVAGGNGR